MKAYNNWIVGYYAYWFSALICFKIYFYYAMKSDFLGAIQKSKGLKIRKITNATLSTMLKLKLFNVSLELRKMPKSFIIKLYSETQVSGPLGMSGGISPRHAQNPLSGERMKTLSITHHALSPPPSHHHLYIIHLINWIQRFYRVIMSLKRPLCRKVT